MAKSHPVKPAESGKTARKPSTHSSPTPKSKSKPKERQPVSSNPTSRTSVSTAPNAPRPMHPLPARPPSHTVPTKPVLSSVNTNTHDAQTRAKSSAERSPEKRQRDRGRTRDDTLDAHGSQSSKRDLTIASGTTRESHRSSRVSGSSGKDLPPVTSRRSRSPPPRKHRRDPSPERFPVSSGSGSVNKRHKVEARPPIKTKDSTPAPTPATRLPLPTRPAQHRPCVPSRSRTTTPPIVGEPRDSRRATHSNPVAKGAAHDSLSSKGKVAVDKSVNDCSTPVVESARKNKVSPAPSLAASPDACLPQSRSAPTPRLNGAPRRASLPAACPPPTAPMPDVIITKHTSAVLPDIHPPERMFLRPAETKPGYPLQGVIVVTREQLGEPCWDAWLEERAAARVRVVEELAEQLRRQDKRAGPATWTDHDVTWVWTKIDRDAVSRSHPGEGDSRGQSFSTSPPSTQVSPHCKAHAADSTAGSRIQDALHETPKSTSQGRDGYAMALPVHSSQTAPVVSESNQLYAQIDHKLSQIDRWLQVLSNNPTKASVIDRIIARIQEQVFELQRC